MTHYDDDVLSRLALDPSLVEDAASVVAHVDDCPVCGPRFDAFKTLDGVMRHPETWANVDSLTTGSSRFLEERALKARLDEEDRNAARRLSPLLVNPLRFRYANIPEKQWAQNAGVVRQLCAAAHRLHEQRPEFSLLITRTAYVIAYGLKDSPHMPRRLCMALSLREAANAFRYLGRFADALKALTEAEPLFDECPASDPYDIAIVWVIRATVLTELGRLDDAQVLSQRSATVFREYGDHMRELAALLVDAGCFYYGGRYSDAIPAFEVVAQRARSASDRHTLARALHNIATAYSNLGEYQKAEEFCIEALVLFDELGLTTEKVRAEWLLAWTMASRGDLAQGAERLYAVREELQGLGLVNDHALATLDWAWTRLGLNETAGIAEACGAIVVRFESEGLMKNARLALAHVNEALARQTATPELLRQVRTYLEDLPNRPTHKFVPA